MTTLCDIFRESARRYPDHVLVHWRGEEWTYSQIWSQSTAVAAWLSGHGLKPGERVGLLAPNTPQYVACYFGVLLAGGVVVALNPETTPRELAHTLVHCRPAAVITTAQCCRHLEAIADQLCDVRLVLHLGEKEPGALPLAASTATFAHVLETATSSFTGVTDDDAQLAQLIYTSGTTGRPKGVTLSHRNLVANCRSIVEYLQLNSTDSVFVILPFFYSYGNSLLLTHVAVGGRLVLASDFVFWNRALDVLEGQQATGFSGVPSTYAMLLHRSDFKKRKFPKLRYVTCAGGALAPAAVAELRECIPHVQMFLMYGQTEAAARLSTLLPAQLDAKLGSIGKGIPGVSLSVLDDERKPVRPGDIGEIVAKGENLMVGYWNDPEATAAVLASEGLHTGDMATVDEDGFIFIVGRRSDMIKSGAYRVNPQEIEEAILELKGVVEAAVVGHPDEILGEVAVAFVTPSLNGDAPSEQAIIDHVKRVLPRHKQIRRVNLVESLPKTSSGKVKRSVLRQNTQGSAEGE